ncbi:MAG: response regulator [Nitrososphaeraceae archaeon]|jgi:DNA-binding NtrC family response regulator|nr:response regulator [Nitrososphaeraceae archaeon]MDW3625424.1 response regulator [Nitrososphaeraceae archaeon]MDW3631458.1 response regulator [Nitrososphaeraceae archaeon]
MSSKYIAIVDDELDIVDLFKEALEMKGYYVSAFTNPLLALNHILKDPTRYSLIISDFRMPEMNGDELVTKLLETNIKVILMSAYHDIECDPNFHFINKPITIPQLLQIVKDITSSS